MLVSHRTDKPNTGSRDHSILHTGPLSYLSYVFIIPDFSGDMYYPVFVLRKYKILRKTENFLLINRLIYLL